MNSKRKVEVFTAGCPACNDIVDMVNQIACPSCDVAILDMNDPKVAARARQHGINSVPAVVVDGRLLECCAGRGVDEASLRAAGIGSPN